MRAVGIILAGGRKTSMEALTNHRNNVAIPIGGAYRAIDFALTDFSLSGIKKVAVISQHNIRSLSDHISSSKWWDLGRKKSGLYLFTPDMLNADTLSFKGTADAIYQNIEFLKKSHEDYVVICSGEQIARMNFNKIIDYHEQKGSDLTIVCKKLEDQPVNDYGVMTLDADNRMIDFEEKPLQPESDIISLGVYVIGRELLINLLEEISKEGRHAFVQDVIIRYRHKLKIYGYFFNNYWKTVKDMNSFYQINMDFLDKDIRNTLLKNKGFVYTKAKDDAPVKYTAGCNVKNSILNGGDIISGTVENSIIFRKVIIEEGAIVKNSIIMESCLIERGAIVENAILDKEVRVTEGKTIIGKKNDPKVIRKKTTI
ncbi:glucose-1-phosphate adenylyltransferase subunit GlgD [Candidatus Epulonipiscium fishelsonii]|uniref:Glucose-1-phosphate adenylyltransferase subunit GlgD n=1 Tax=Candidatus Epulonipiscium fishelsonii TaxID=77094 RepID=A0ACC8X9F4_9FIRM|nr:glucose-1-phosphate adenylyltransferase subunit GlgD [Epulopiscium sp. SCG-B05WGA-EpuloA1]ONI38800.1 glucose-1-phosphate adenylyltransferase subunit GlgD [Epulopiscium sp. SCG-B11WGA-EpuloA1]